MLNFTVTAYSVSEEMLGDGNTIDEQYVSAQHVVVVIYIFLLLYE